MKRRLGFTAASRAIGAARRVMVAGLLLWSCPGATAVQPVEIDGYRSEEVAGWVLDQPEVEPSPAPDEAVRGARMVRRTADYRIQFEVNGGIQRTVGVQRLNCGDVTDANGGSMYSVPIYVSGTIEEAAAAARASAREADAGFDENCPARPAAFAAALAGLETAIVTLERWARERPLPAIEAWSRGYWSVERTEPPVTIRFGRPPDGQPERELEVESACGESFFSERVALPAPARPEDRRRAAVALADLLGRADAQCRLPAGQPARLAQGFEEALAASAAEEE